MATNYNHEEVADWHPEMILVSKSPVTWQGFLIISNSSYAAHDARSPRVKLKLIIPNYPLFCNAQINFGRQIANLRSNIFSEKVKNLMKTSLTVPVFLTQLQLLIGQHMHNENHMNDLSVSDLLQDIRTALQNPSDVQISCDRNLNIIKLSLRDVSLILERSNNTEIPWKIISSDLPKIPTFENFEKNVINLSVAITKFKWQVELLDKAWEQLREIDENCWVIDPLEPNKSNMFRRIHLSQCISVTITIDPLNPTALPVIKFSGSDNEVKRQTDYVSDNIHNWDPDCSVLTNLKMLLNMYDFPEQQESMEDNNAVIGSHECGICFFARSDTDELSDRICNNKKCLKYYHSICLSKWLQTKAGNQVVFDHIHGTCPHCKEKISCPIK